MPPMTGLLRSILFVPGGRPDRFAKALASGADAVVFDLEDSVEAVAQGGGAPRGRRVPRRRRPMLTVTRLVRVNAAGSPWFAEDLECVGTLAAHRRRGAAQGRACAARRGAGARHGERGRSCPLLETARGILDAAAIAGADARVPALLFGAEDSDGAARRAADDRRRRAASSPGRRSCWRRPRPAPTRWTPCSSRSATPTACAATPRRARALGFRGKMAIHPGQVAAINDVFTPTAAEIERARQLVDAYESALRARRRRHPPRRHDDRHAGRRASETAHREGAARLSTRHLSTQHLKHPAYFTHTFLTCV